jgi:hypothetical protein
MTEQQKARVLRTVLPVVGVIFIFGVALLMRLWPAGWQWQPNQHEYEQMFQVVYATLGVFLILAAKAPARHRSLILFAAWSSLGHAGIMGVQAMRDAAERGHLIGDVPALAVVGIVLLVFAPKAIGSSSHEHSTHIGEVAVPVARH